VLPELIRPPVAGDGSGTDCEQSAGSVRQKAERPDDHGDDIGWLNPSCNHRRIFGYRTPNIDRIAGEGALFTDWYGPQNRIVGSVIYINTCR
jgi:hypothetical protein